MDFGKYILGLFLLVSVGQAQLPMPGRQVSGGDKDAEN